MRISEVAQRAGVSVKTVRHYESLGLVRSSRLQNGYRDYGEDAARLVSEAHALGRVGIRLEQTRPFLECLSSGNENADDCVATRHAYREAIDELTERIDELQRRRSAVEALLAAAEAREEPGCSLSPGHPAGSGAPEQAMGTNRSPRRPVADPVPDSPAQPEREDNQQ